MKIIFSIIIKLIISLLEKIYYNSNRAIIYLISFDLKMREPHKSTILNIAVPYQVEHSSTIDIDDEELISFLNEGIILANSKL